MHGLGELVPAVHHTLEHMAQLAATVPSIGSFLSVVTPTLLDTVGGIIAGAMALLIVTAVRKLLGKSTEQQA